MKHNWLKEFWHYRELFYFMVWRDIKVRYKQSLLGAGWAVIQPFFTMVVFTLFFGKMAKMPTDGIPYPIFSYSAVLPWTFFSQALTRSGNSLVANTNLITKVYFPRICIPTATTISGLLDLAMASVLLVGLMFYYKIEFSLGLILWPFLVVLLVLLALGVGMIFASLNVKYRDIKHTLPFVVQLWLFMTPIIYPTSIIPERFRILIAFNPAAGIIEAFRACILPNKPVDWNSLWISGSITLVIFVVALFYFRKTERAFADII